MRSLRTWTAAGVAAVALAVLGVSVVLGSWGGGTGTDAVAVDGTVRMVDTQYWIDGTLTSLCEVDNCNVVDDNTNNGGAGWRLDFGQQDYYLPTGFGVGGHTIQGKLAAGGEIDVYVVDGTPVGREDGGPPPGDGPTPTPQSEPDTDGNGCTPGYWKNNLVAWGPTGLLTTDSFEVVFGTAPDPITVSPTMHETLGLGGGGIIALSRHAAAALLNALHPSVDYALSPEEVISAYQSALADGSQQAIEAQKDAFELLNRAGCSIDAHGEPVPTTEPLSVGEPKPVPLDSDGDGVSDGEEKFIYSTDPTDLDTDDDSCTDGQEVGDNPGAGGQRDPTDPWDYFNPEGDGYNRSDDIQAVIDHYHVDEGDPAYSTQYDRGGQTGTNPWNQAPPDGTIRSPDIYAIVMQYRHDCGTGIVKPTPTPTP